MKKFYAEIIKHPLSALYGIILLILALKQSILQLLSGDYEFAAIDFVMACLLIRGMMKSVFLNGAMHSSRGAEFLAYVGIAAANSLVILPSNSFAGSLSSAFALAILISSFVLYFSSYKVALDCLAPTLWTCVFMPYHEELMLMGSYPLRLSATLLSGFLVKLLGVEVIYSGTSIRLPNLDIAITDACSGINQLDAFILIAYVMVILMHRKSIWKLLHFAFIIPSIIIGNTIRIVITILLFNLLGDAVLDNLPHVILGYVQIVIALIIFIAVGKLFSETATEKTEGEL